MQNTSTESANLTMVDLLSLVQEEVSRSNDSSLMIGNAEFLRFLQRHLDDPNINSVLLSTLHELEKILCKTRS